MTFQKKKDSFWTKDGTMHRRTGAFVLSLCVLALSGCVDFYGDQRPVSNTKWVSETPEISFVIIEGFDCFGKIVAGDRTIPIRAVFDFGRGLALTDTTGLEMTSTVGPTVLSGVCEFHPDRFILTGIKDRYGILDDSVTEIVFTRIDLGEAPPAYPGTKWASEPPGVSFSVGEDGKCTGQTVVGREAIPTEIQFDHRLRMTLVDTAREHYGMAPGLASDMLYGQCEYYPDRFVVTDIEDLYGVLYPPVDEIVFRRVGAETGGQG